MDLRIGGEYRWTVTPGHHAAGTFQEIEPGKRIVFTWGWESGMDLAPGASTVTITLEPDADGTSLRLVHEGLTAEQAAAHAEGWNHYLDRLLAETSSAAGAGPDEWSAAPDSDRSLQRRRGLARRAPGRAAQAHPGGPGESHPLRSSSPPTNCWSTWPGRSSRSAARSALTWQTTPRQP